MKKISGKKFVLISGLFGNALEWYDFILFANFAPIIATIFFPTKNSATSLLLTFAVFATGFLARPLGAIFFGYIGDHFGRRIALIISITLITIPTLFIGFLPTFAMIGVIAPLLLTILRILQGIAISGELNSATTFLVEYADQNRRGLMGALVMATACGGMLVGSLMTFILSSFLSHQTLYSWGWRLPFWLSGCLGIIGIIIRIKTNESPKYLAEKDEEKNAPLKHIFLHHKKDLLLSFWLTSIPAVANYTFIAYLPTFLTKSQKFSLHDTSIINLTSMFSLTLLTPVFGLLSDKVGRKPIFLFGISGFVLFSLPIFWLLSQQNFTNALVGALFLSVLVATTAALIPTILAEIFPTHVRNSGTTIVYNLALAIFGGTAPLVSLTLVDITGNSYAPAYYLMLCAIISSFALYFIEEKFQFELT